MKSLEQRDSIAETTQRMIVHRNNNKANAFVYLLLVFHFLLFASISFAAIFDRVVAFVDNQAITLSEFREQYRKALRVSPDITDDEVINTMINRLLLLRDAKKYRIEAPSPEEIIKEYINLKIRASITVGESEIEAFYKTNINRFPGKELEDVRGEIEKYLTEKELNERLKETLRDLRKNAYIKIQINPSEAF